GGRCVDRASFPTRRSSDLRCVQQSEPWNTKVRRVRLSTALSLVLFVIAMALWSRRNQCQVWNSLVGKLSDLHPAEPDSSISDSRSEEHTSELQSRENLVCR